MSLRRLLSSRGFTLIELLVVILVIAVLIAVAAPSFLGQTQKAEDSAAKQYLTIAYKAAKFDTVERNGNYGTPAQVAAAIEASEQGLLTAAVGICPLGVTSTDPTDIIVDSNTGGTDLQLCNDPKQRIWTLTVANHRLLPFSLCIKDAGVCQGDETPATATPPVNDNFADAIAISGSTGNESAGTEGATTEAGENLNPANFTGDQIGHTVWYLWTAPAAGDYVFDTWGSTNQNPAWDTPGTSYDSVLAVYTGSSLANLSLTGVNNDDNYVGSPGGYVSRLGLTGVQAGETFYIQVAGYGAQAETWAEWGNLELNWALGTVEEPPPPPAAPGPASGPTLTGAPYQGETLTVAATFSGDEPINITYAWDRCFPVSSVPSCTEIPGATASTYVLTAADLDHRIHAKVTATNTVGNYQAVSSMTAIVTPSASSSAPSASYSAAVTASSPVGYWRLGDASGTTAVATVGPDGTYQCRMVGTASCGGQEPVLGVGGAIAGNSAAHFPVFEDVGPPYLLQGGQLGVPYSAALNTPSFTVEAWVKIAVGAQATTKFLGSRDSNGNGFGLTHDSNADRLYVQLGDASSSGGYSVCYADGLSEGEWHYVAASWNNTTELATCMIDGVAAGGNPAEVFSYEPSAGPLQAGYPSSDPGSANAVSIDELAVYDTALRSYEMNQHYLSR